MNDRYESPLSQRYASREMQYLFSPDKKFRTWRKLWIALAETEKELGLNITQEQIDELKAHADDINYEVAREREKLVRHDVMSHVYAYGQQCPGAKGIIHLGATSCYVGDNTDIIIMTEALRLVRRKLINVMAELADYGRVREQYSLYSATEEEQTHIDRMEVLDLLDGALGTQAKLNTVSVSGDAVQLQFSGVTLAQTAQIVRTLEASPIVASTRVNTASTTEGSGALVQASVFIQLQKEEGP